jgi:hypothetical protein
VIALLAKPEPLRVPVMDLPLTVAVKFRLENPGAAKVRPTEGAEYVPVTVSATDADPTSVPVPLTFPDVSVNTRFNVNGVPPDVVALPLQLPATVVLGPLESPAQATMPVKRHKATARTVGLIERIFMKPPDKLIALRGVFVDYSGGLTIRIRDG